MDVSFLKVTFSYIEKLISSVIWPHQGTVVASRHICQYISRDIDIFYMFGRFVSPRRASTYILQVVNSSSTTLFPYSRMTRAHEISYSSMSRRGHMLRACRNACVCMYQRINLFKFPKWYIAVINNVTWHMHAHQAYKSQCRTLKVLWSA